MLEPRQPKVKVHTFSTKGVARGAATAQVAARLGEHSVIVIDMHADHDPAGYLVTDGDMRWSVPGFFVAGDVHSRLIRQITTAVGDATTAVFAAGKYLQEERPESDAPAVEAPPETQAV